MESLVYVLSGVDVMFDLIHKRYFVETQDIRPSGIAISEKSSEKK
jgi:hypothetical protein